MTHLDPNRPHGLSDVIDRFFKRDGEHRLPSWTDVCRVREYVGAEAWQAQRANGNDYDLALNVLYHLVDVEGARSSIEPYLTSGCRAHDVPAGRACIEDDSAFACFFSPDLKKMSLPPRPYVCARRVLAAHDREDAAKIFEQEPRAGEETSGPSLANRCVLPISAAVTPEDGVAIARMQHRDPWRIGISRIFISQGGDWTIRDVRVDGRSIVAPHHDLPGFVFGTHVRTEMRLPALEQDQWIEIEARRVRGEMPWFYASVLGTQQREERAR